MPGILPIATTAEKPESARPRAQQLQYFQSSNITHGRISTAVPYLPDGGPLTANSLERLFLCQLCGLRNEFPSPFTPYRDGSRYALGRLLGRLLPPDHPMFKPLGRVGRVIRGV